jgi:hypothetical protein
LRCADSAAAGTVIAHLGCWGISEPRFETGRRRDTHFEPGGVLFRDCQRPSRLGWLARTEADFEEHRRKRAFHAWKEAMWEAGLELPTQVADGRTTCFCGAAIGAEDVESHIIAAHMETA